MNQSLEKLNPALAKKLKEQKENKKVQKSKQSKQKKRAETAVKRKNKSPSPEAPKPKKGGLTQEEQLVKEKLIGGGQFDAVGQKFQRNRK